ncbi:MAG: 50S ribosomal protein L23 [Egibacteraceae bacterium]
MKYHHDVVLSPVVSEKSYGLIDEGRYTFIVDTGTNKTEIKQAIEQIFGVRVVKVNTMNRKGKRKRRGTNYGKRKDTKRAYVTLADGDEIDIFSRGV